MRVYPFFSFITIVVLAGCGGPSAEEYFAKAQQAQTAQEFQQAMDLYEKVISEHPEDPAAGDAMFMIATILNNDLHDYDAAVDAYKRYVGNHPEGKETAIAMFLIGYLYNNELQNFDSASVAYRRFLEKFPNHEMSQAAQFELDNLGKSPEELLGQASSTTTAESRPITTNDPTKKKPPVQ